MTDHTPTEPHLSYASSILATYRRQEDGEWPAQVVALRVAYESDTTIILAIVGSTPVDYRVMAWNYDQSVNNAQGIATFTLVAKA